MPTSTCIKRKASMSIFGRMTELLLLSFFLSDTIKLMCTQPTHSGNKITGE